IDAAFTATRLPARRRGGIGGAGALARCVRRATDDDALVVAVPDRDRFHPRRFGDLEMDDATLGSGERLGRHFRRSALHLVHEVPRHLAETLDLAIAIARDVDLEARWRGVGHLRADHAGEEVLEGGERLAIGAD